ncbi:MAG: polyamine aminopropyltransferase [Usitatibacteraceae bacterium]
MRLDEPLNAESGTYFDGTLMDSLRTPYQLIEVFDTPALGKLMRIDGANMTSERDEFFYHENLVHPAAIAHASPRKVLIVGGGDGGSSEEILKHPSVERVVLAELDQGVIDIAKKYFHSVHRDVFENPKLDVRIVDGAAFIKTTKHEFDLIYLDLTDPIGPAAALYTQDFFRDCRSALAAGGALALHIGSPFAQPERVASSMRILRAAFSRVAPYFVHIPSYGAVWGFAVASDAIDPRTLDSRAVEQALTQRGIGDRQYYDGRTHEAMLALPGYIKTLIG